MTSDTEPGSAASSYRAVQPEREQGQNRRSGPSYRPPLMTAVMVVFVAAWVAQSVAVVLLLAGVIR